MDEYKIDNHKLAYHPHRVSDWLRNKPIYPIYVEIGPYAGCNHSCIFCAFDYIKYQSASLNTAVLKSSINSMAEIGVKAIMYSGEGEPLLHKDIADIVNYTKEKGIDVSITTNGVFLTKEFSESCLRSLSWVKVSIDAGKPGTYAKIHGADSKDFFKVLENLEKSIQIRNHGQYDCIVGAQALLLPENADELPLLAIELKKIGVDYLVVKPFTDHPNKEKDIGDLKYDELLRKVKSELLEIASDKFSIVVRNDTFQRLNVNRCYGQCYALDYWSFIDACGDVYACSNYLKNNDYVYGNINKNPFGEIWNERKKVNVQLSNCRQICRMDKINQYLWELRHPSQHINFI